MIHTNVEILAKCVNCIEMNKTVDMLNELGRSVYVYTKDNEVPKCICTEVGATPICGEQSRVMQLSSK